MLYLTPLERALDRLKEGWVRHATEPSDEQLRDGLIQRFEFTYELSHKTLKRFLEQNSTSPDEYDRMGFPDLIRSANEAGLLKGSWAEWSVYRKMRNLTSHTHEEAREAQRQAEQKFSGNKIFTAEKYAAARKRLMEKFGNLNAGFAPELMPDVMTVAGSEITARQVVAGIPDFIEEAAFLLQVLKERTA